jgi:hypothetical protein
VGHLDGLTFTQRWLCDSDKMVCTGVGHSSVAVRGAERLFAEMAVVSFCLACIDGLAPGDG